MSKKSKGDKIRLFFQNYSINECVNWWKTHKGYFYRQVLFKDGTVSPIKRVSGEDFYSALDMHYGG